MKKMFLILAMLIFASQAMAGVVTLTINQDMNDTASRIGELRYSSPNDISGFGLKITADNGALITSVTADHEGDSSTANGKGFGIFPESFATFLDAQSPDWGDGNYVPVAPNTAPGAAGTGLDTNTVILEMGALYEDYNEPNLAGRLCVFTVSADCNVTVTADSTRGNVVLADTTEAGFTGDTTLIKASWGWDYPDCWDYTTQCHADVDANSTVDTDDWPAFRDGFGGVHPDSDYLANPCGDYNRDGIIDTDDWPQFRDNFGEIPESNCVPGDDAHEVYKP